MEESAFINEKRDEEIAKENKKTKEQKRSKNREYQRAWRHRRKILKKKDSKEEKEEEKRKRHCENQRAYYQRTKELKKNDKNVEELSQKKLDDLQMKRKKLDSNEDQEKVVQCTKFRKNSSLNLENIQLDQNQFLTQQLRIYEESRECITPKVILHRNTDIPGDGNCLFHSLIHVLQLQILTCDLRKQLRDSPYLDSCQNPQEAYNILSSNNEYGDLDCLYLFTKIYNQNICVHYHYLNVISKNEDTRFCHFKENDTHNWIHLDLRDLHFTSYFTNDEKKKEDERKKKQRSKEYSKRYRDKKRTSNLCTKFRKKSSQNLENVQLDQNQFLTQQLRIYEESHECITPKVILHRNTDIPVPDAVKNAGDVCRKMFETELATLYESSSRTTKPQWTQSRIENIIKLIEEYMAAPKLGIRRSNTQYHYGNKYEIETSSDGKKFLIKKRKNKDEPYAKIIPSEEYYDILSEVHHKTGHGGRDKMITALKTDYVIPSPAINIFVKLCKVCQNRRSNILKNNSTLAVAEVFNNRGKVEFIDMQAMPDQNYKWIMHYQECTTKYSFLRALFTISLNEIATELLKIFLEVGCPAILETAHDRKFTAAIIQKVESFWPACKILNGKPEPDESRKPRETVQERLITWMNENASRNWSTGVYFVQFNMNTYKTKSNENSPFKAFFGRDPKTGLKNSHLNHLFSKAQSEEDLETLVFKDSKQKSTDAKDATQEEDSAEEGTSLQEYTIEIGEPQIVEKNEPPEYIESDPLQVTVKQEIEEYVFIDTSEDISEHKLHIEDSDDDSSVKIKKEIEVEITVEDEGVQTKRMKIQY